MLDLTDTLGPNGLAVTTMPPVTFRLVSSRVFENQALKYVAMVRTPRGEFREYLYFSANLLHALI